MPYMGREEFLERISEDLDQDLLFEADQYHNVYDGHDDHKAFGRDIPHGIVVRAVVEHREGMAIRAEFLELRGDSMAENWRIPTLEGSAKATETEMAEPDILWRTKRGRCEWTKNYSFK